jgi:hypothetical protein
VDGAKRMEADMSDEQQTRRRMPALPPVEADAGLPREEEAPVEAVRAIAALLGRAALPRRRAAAPPERAASSTPAEADPVSLVGDREVPIEGVVGVLDDRAASEVRDARKRLKRSQRRVEEALERLADATPEGLSS